MKIRKQIIYGITALCLFFVSSSHAIIGVGVHYGLDLSVSMEDQENIPLSLKEYTNVFDVDSFFNSVPIPVDSIDNMDIAVFLDSLRNQGVQPSDIPLLSGDLPFYISRTGFERYPLNIGGKVFVDIIPVLDAVEISMNFGLWQYDGEILYPKNIKADLDAQALLDDPTSVSFQQLFEMESIPVTLEQFDLAYFGLNKTPYAKLHIDATVRKNIISVPKRMKIFRLYGGGGPSVHFATPVLDQEMVEDVLKDIIAESDGNINDLAAMLNGDPQALKPIVEKIIEGLAVPKFGMHIVAGAMIKLPVVPLGFYADGKFMIPFGDFNEDAGLKGYGLLINAGLTFGL
ncbi:MAG: hypothetical protein GF401_17190 [Chitinivibrionales bacterium]|nr:hypothetical protein [Chitinivibrionales bacterium]